MKPLPVRRIEMLGLLLAFLALAVALKTDNTVNKASRALNRTNETVSLLTNDLRATRDDIREGRKVLMSLTDHSEASCPLADVKGPLSEKVRELLPQDGRIKAQDQLDPQITVVHSP